MYSLRGLYAEVMVLFQFEDRLKICVDVYENVVTYIKENGKNRCFSI